MSESYVGEIRMFGGNFAPEGWLPCDGRLLPISEYETIFQLIGTTYGGDGQVTFALPNLCSRVPIHMGQGSGLPNYYPGEMSGVETVTLTVGSMASHSHGLMATKSEGNSNKAQGNVTAANTIATFYYEDAPSPTAKLDPGAIQPNGGNQPHNNIQPFLVLNFIISMYGTYPPPG